MANIIYAGGSHNGAIICSFMATSIQYRCRGMAFFITIIIIASLYRVGRSILKVRKDLQNDRKNLCTRFSNEDARWLMVNGFFVKEDRVRINNN